MGFDPESREMENVYELIPDEYFTVRRNYLRTFYVHRKKKNSNDNPNCVEKLVFDGSDAQYHADAVH